MELWSPLALSILLVLPTQAEAKSIGFAPEPDSPWTKLIKAKLDEPIAMVFPNETLFGDVVVYIKQATREGPLDKGIPIYVDPVGLQDAGRTMTSVVKINERDATLKVSLKKVLDQLGLSYLVRDGVLMISSPAFVRQAMIETPVIAKDSLPKSIVVMARLDQHLAMPFPEMTTLEDVLKYVDQKTREPHGNRGIPITIIPNALDEAKVSLRSVICNLDLEGVPLKTTLRLVLRQLDLDYFVKEGRVFIHTAEFVRKMKSTVWTLRR